MDGWIDPKIKKKSQERHCCRSHREEKFKVLFFFLYQIGINIYFENGRVLFKQLKYNRLRKTSREISYNNIQDQSLNI